MKKLQISILISSSLLMSVPSGFSSEKGVLVSSPFQFSGYQSIPDYLNAIGENTSLNEVVDFFFGMRDLMIREGHQVPILSKMVEEFINEIKNQRNIQLDEQFIETFYEAIVCHEESIAPVSLDQLGSLETTKVQIHLARECENKEIMISNGMAKGFCKALGGALLCIIPHPVAWGVGGGLIVSGVSDMIESADDPNGITMGELDRQVRERQRIGMQDMSFSFREKRLNGAYSSSLIKF